MPTRSEATKPGETIITTAGPLDGVMERVFDAPVEKVFRAHVDPELIPRWWGPAHLTTRVDHIDARTGGSWRIVQRDKDGTEHAFHGEYREVVPNTRIVWTFVYEPFPDKVVVEEYAFEDIGGRTRLRVLSKFPDKETLEGMTAAGMEEGARETWERLAALVEKA